MVNQSDANGDALLQQVIEHLRRQDIPDFPDLEITAAENTNEHTSSVHPISPLWRMATNRRFQLSAGAIVGLAAVFGFLLLWGGSVVQSVSAMEKMAESIRQAKSYKTTMSARLSNTDEVGNPSHKRSMSINVITYWLASGSLRQDILSTEEVIGEGGKVFPVWQGPGPECTEISFLGKPGIRIDHRTKTFRRWPARPVNPDHPVSAALSPQDWGKFSGQADRELGTREINGKKACGFQIDVKKISPESVNQGTAEIWLDPDSNLPVYAHMESEKPSGELLAPQILTLEMQWNLDLDPRLFDVTPPRGYEEVFPVLPPETRQP